MPFPPCTWTLENMKEYNCEGYFLRDSDKGLESSFCCAFFESESHCVAQASLELL